MQHEVAHSRAVQGVVDAGARARAASFLKAKADGAKSTVPGARKDPDLGYVLRRSIEPAIPKPPTASATLRRM